MKYTRIEKEKVKELYFKGNSVLQIQEKTGLNNSVINFMINNLQSFRIYEKNGITYKVCKNCGVERVLKENYYKSGFSKITGKQLYKPLCKFCTDIINKNKAIISGVDKDKVREKNQKRYKKYGKENKMKKIQEMKEDGKARKEYLRKQRIYQKKRRAKKKLGLA